MALTAASNLENPNKPAGLSVSDVESTIADNVQWQHIETFEMDNFNEVIFNNDKMNNHDMIKIVWEGIDLGTQVSANVRLYFNGTEATASSYVYSFHQMSGSSRSASSTTGATSWAIIGTYTPDRGLTGEFEFVTKPDRLKTLRWSFGGRQSSNVAIRMNGYGIYNNATDRVSAIKFFVSGDNISSGKMHMYGRNEHA